MVVVGCKLSLSPGSTDYVIFTIFRSSFTSHVLFLDSLNIQYMNILDILEF
jgi:hypothetical protein